MEEILSLLAPHNARLTYLGQATSHLWAATVFYSPRGGRRPGDPFGMSSSHGSPVAAVREAIENMKNYGWKPAPPRPGTVVLNLELGELEL